MAPVYTTATEVEAYLTDQPGGVPSSWTSADSDGKDDLVESAERDLDLLVATVPVDTVTGRRLGAVLANLPTYQVTAIKNAVAAQVEYRLAAGGPFFVEHQYMEVKGPVFTTRGKRPVVGPKTKRELALAALDLGRGRSKTRDA